MPHVNKKRKIRSDDVKSRDVILSELINELSSSISILPSDHDSISRYYYFLLNKNADDVQFSFEEIKKVISCKKIEDLMKGRGGEKPYDDILCGIINSLHMNEEKTFMSFNKSIDINAYPEKKLFIRECYKEKYFEIMNDIKKSKKNDLHFVVIGQTGNGNSSFAYYMLMNVKNEKENVLKGKEIYFIKSNESMIYKYVKREGCCVLEHLNGYDINDVNNSIVICENYGEVPNNNIIISISCPNEEFYQYYLNSNSKTTYFDIFNPDEVRMWFRICLNYDNGVVDENVMSDYGNNPKHIYNHYIYRDIFQKDYWEEYKQLIKKLMSIKSYKDFFDEYMLSENYKYNEFMYLALHYKLKDGKPQKYLSFNSRRISYVLINSLGLNFDSNKIRDDCKYLYKVYKEIDDYIIESILYKALVIFIISLNPEIVKDITPFIDIGEKGAGNYRRLHVDNMVDGEFKSQSFYFLNEYDDRYDFVVNDCIFKIFYDDCSLQIDDDEYKKIYDV